MKVFVDTNVILEYFMHREKFEEAEKSENETKKNREETEKKFWVR